MTWPHDLTPTSDANVGGWVNEDGTTPLWSHLGVGDFIESRRRFVNGPQRILFLSTDDGMNRARMDYSATITQCVAAGRIGQKARHHTNNRIIDVGQMFEVARTDHSPCSPGRCAFMNGLRSPSHGNSKVIDTEYYDLIREGKRVTHVYDNDQKVRGPVERDCNAIAAEAFFADVNQAAGAWNSGTAYVAGNQVTETISGLVHYFIALKSGTNRRPSQNCDGTADYWRHYGTLNAATKMRAQQSVDAWEQPYAGDLVGSNGRRVHWYGRAKGLVAGAIGAPHSEDDLQWSTGGWNTWLTYTGVVKCYGLEKHQNIIGIPAAADSIPGNQSADPSTWTYWQSGSYVVGNVVAYLGYFYTCTVNVTSSTAPPSDASHWTAGTPSYTTAHVAPAWRRAVFSADDDQDHYRNSHIDFDELIGGPNPATSVYGQIGVNSLLRYDWDVATLSYNSGTGKVTVVAVDPIPGLSVGEVLDISVDYSTSAAATPIGGTNWVEPEISATCTDGSKTFTYTPTATPTGTPNVTDTFVYIRKFYETVWYTDRHIEMLDDVSPYDNIVVYHGFHNPHWSTLPTGGVVRTDTESQCERRYENSKYSSVPLSQGFMWQGVSGAHQPSISTADDADTGGTSDRRHWASRQNMFASQDDAIGRILDAWDAKFGVGQYYVILVDDNGYQYGSHHDEEGVASAPVGAKVWTWENSVRVTTVMVGPEFEPGSSSTLLVELADIPLTILDIMAKSVPSLATHFAHDKRDGTSIIRKLGGAAADQHQFVRGAYLTGNPNGSGIGGSSTTTNHVKVIDKDGNALARLYQGSNIIESTTPAATWISGHSYSVGDQIIYSGTYYTCIAAVSGSVVPTSDPAHWSNQGRRLFLGAGPGSGEPDPAEDETIDHSFDSPATQALGDTLATMLSRLMVGRWDPATSTHSGKI